MKVIMSLKIFLIYEAVRLVVCQSFYKKKIIKIIPRKCKRHLKKKNWTFSDEIFLSPGLSMTGFQRQNEFCR